MKTIKNHTILSTYQELIRRTKQKKHTYHQLYLYWATHMFWNICDDYYIQFIFLTVSKALAVFLSIIIYLHHRTILNKNNWSPITTTNIRTYYKFISIKFCQKLFSYTKKEEHCEFIYIGRLFEGEVLQCIPSSL